MQPFYTVAFYNCENLFDTEDDPNTLDEDFTPNGSRKWTQERYQNKIGKLAMAISKIGKDDTGFLPTLVGLAEVENKTVIQDLIQDKNLGTEEYDFVHFDSDDERGIDVALLYNSKVFYVEYAEPIHPPMLYDGGAMDRTRDFLYVKGKLRDTSMHIFVMHLPSQREENINLTKRQAIVQKIRGRINHIMEDEPNPYIIVLGDFNTNPESDSLKKVMKAADQVDLNDRQKLYNPMELLVKDGFFTTVHRTNWLMYDQMLFSAAFFSEYAKPTLVNTHIFNPYFLQEWNRNYRFQPFRTYAGRKYLGGFSDHFPVFSILKM